MNHYFYFEISPSNHPVVILNDILQVSDSLRLHFRLSSFFHHPFRILELFFSRIPYRSGVELFFGSVAKLLDEQLLILLAISLDILFGVLLTHLDLLDERVECHLLEISVGGLELSWSF